MDTTRQPSATVVEERPQAAAPQAPAPPADAPAAAAPARPRIWLYVVIGIVAIVALIFGIRYLAYAMTHQSTDDAQIDADLVEVTSKISERVDRILVDTNQYVHKGQVLALLDDVDERENVNAAQAALDAQLAQAHAAQENVALTADTQSAQNQQNSGAIAQARANIQSAAAQAQSAGRQVAANQAALDASRAELKSAQDGVPGAYQNLAKAQADLNRTNSLVHTGDLSVSQLDASRAAYEAARSAYSQAQANVAAAAANVAQAQERVSAQQSTYTSNAALVGVQQGQLTKASGQLAESAAPNRVPAEQAQANAAIAQAEQLRSQLANAKTRLGYTVLRSPIDGYVGQKNVEVGQTVSPGESIMTLVPSNRIYVTANFKETQMKDMRVGQPVDISVDACKGIALYGHVDNMSPAAQNKFSLVPPQNATGNFVKITQRLPVRILFDKPDSRCVLRPGYSVEASVKVK